MAEIDKEDDVLLIGVGVPNELPPDYDETLALMWGLARNPVVNAEDFVEFAELVMLQLIENVCQHITVCLRTAVEDEDAQKLIKKRLIEGARVDFLVARDMDDGDVRQEETRMAELNAKLSGRAGVQPS